MPHNCTIYIYTLLCVIFCFVVVFLLVHFALAPPCFIAYLYVHFPVVCSVFVMLLLLLLLFEFQCCIENVSMPFVCKRSNSMLVRTLAALEIGIFYAVSFIVDSIWTLMFVSFGVYRVSIAWNPLFQQMNHIKFPSYQILALNLITTTQTIVIICLFPRWQFFLVAVNRIAIQFHVLFLLHKLHFMPSHQMVFSK